MGEEGEKIERESSEESEGFGRGPAMDTPNRNQITTPLSQFEVIDFVPNFYPFFLLGFCDLGKVGRACNALIWSSLIVFSGTLKGFRYWVWFILGGNC